MGFTVFFIGFVCTLWDKGYDGYTSGWVYEIVVFTKYSTILPVDLCFVCMVNKIFDVIFSPSGFFRTSYFGAEIAMLLNILER